jgi:hypothetical protein
MRFALAIAAVLSFLAASAQAEEQKIVRAAPLRQDAEWPPRRLFNAGLDAEQKGNLTHAVQLYMSARLAQRVSIADDLYVRGAALRLVRILSGYDDDAAAAVATLIKEEAGDRASTDLAPLIRSLLRRADKANDDHELSFMTGTIVSIRVPSGASNALIELRLDGEGERRIIGAEGPVGPFSAGDPVRVMVKRDSARAASSWKLIGMAHAKADGWQILAISGLPGEPGPAYGALIGH